MAVVSAFRPTADLVRNVGLLAAQVDQVVVVDDGSGPGYDDVLAEVRAAGADVVVLDENQGIAAALNAGLDAAALGPRDLVVTFDQDSAVPQGFVAALVGQWDAAVGAGLPVGMVSPELFAGVGQGLGGPDEHGFVDSREPIQSGSLTSGGVLAAVGPLRADLFIDLVDKEFALRLRGAGLRCLVAPGLDLPHELGRTYPFTFLGRQVRVGGRARAFTLSTPFRYYYRARNRMVVNRDYRRSQKELVRADTVADVRDLLIVLYCARPRRAMLRVVARGVRDGRRGRLGKMPDDVAALAAEVTWRVDPI